LRPPLALERLTKSSRGQVVFELPHPRADGATHLLLDPLELIEKLTLPIPPSRFHTLRFHGVLGLGVHTGGERLRALLERLGLVSASPAAEQALLSPQRGT
jgi:Putative transposase